MHSVEKWYTKHRDSLYIIFRKSSFIIILLISAANIASSLLISPQAIKLVSGDTNAFISFVRSAYTLPDFDSHFQSEIDGRINEHAGIIFADEHKRNELISQLEDSLTRHPDSTVVLKALSVLYTQQKMSDKSAQMQTQLMQLDPAYSP